MLEPPRRNMLERLQDNIAELEDITERLREMNEMDESHNPDYPDNQEDSKPC